MANHPSAQKRHRQSLKRRLRNRNAKAAIRTAIKKTSAYIEKGELDAAKKEASIATRLLDKAGIHGILHKNTVARSISRLQSRVNTGSAAKE